jgi:hypothetical protein
MPRTHLIRIAPLWVLCLIAGSVLPGPAKAVLGTSAHLVMVNGDPQQATIQFRHRVYHFFSFGSTAFLLLLIARTRTQRLCVCLATIALGLAIEYAQHWISQAPVEWWDVRDDAYAVFAVWLLGQWPALRHALVAVGR